MSMIGVDSGQTVIGTPGWLRTSETGWLSGWSAFSQL